MTERRNDIGTKMIIGCVGMCVAVIGFLCGTGVDRAFDKLDMLSTKAYANETCLSKHESEYKARVGGLEGHVNEMSGDIKVLRNEVVVGFSDVQKTLGELLLKIETRG